MMWTKRLAASQAHKYPAMAGKGPQRQDPQSRCKCAREPVLRDLNRSIDPVHLRHRRELDSKVNTVSAGFAGRISMSNARW